MTRPAAVLVAVVIACAGLFLRAEEQLRTLTGSCRISATADATRLKLRLEHDQCARGMECGSQETDEPADAFLGFILADLKREGAHVEAVLRGEAGTLT